MKDLHNDLCINSGPSNGIIGLPQYPAFISFWKKFFSYVKFPDRHYLGKCDTCLEIKQLRSKTALNKEQHDYLSKILKEHNNIQQSERMAYKTRAEEGQRNPSNILSIIMDTMRMKMIPHVFPFPKALSSMNTLAVIIFGILNHSNDSQCFYLHHVYWLGGANIVMSYLFQYILDYFRKGNLPTTLIIQVDNSWKESKNKVIFATLAWFVHIGLFSRIELHCLIQGHTHEDIDQTFSSIARAFWITSVFTLEIFRKIICKTFKRPTETPNFNSVWNFSEFFEGITTNYTLIYNRSFA